jgi:hypothetical protein
MAVPATRTFFLWYLGVGTVLYFAYGLWFSKLGRSGPTFEAEIATMGTHPPVD